MAKLQRLHAAAGALVEHTPEIISHPKAARSLDQALMEALVECLGETTRTEQPNATIRWSCAGVAGASKKIPIGCCTSRNWRRRSGSASTLRNMLPGAAGAEPRAIP